MEPNPVPIASPRSRSESKVKKPVPLPRLRIPDDSFMLTDLEETLSIHSDDSHNSTGNKDSRRQMTKTIKKELKSASESVQERGKAVMESTRSASARIEKSVRCMIDKRRSGSQPRPTHSVEKEQEIVGSSPQSQTLPWPTEDIFQSISFQSPIDERNDEYKESLSDLKVEVLSEDEIDAISPPIYPPPPLPDESVYDEVQYNVSSNVSSRSSNYDPYSWSNVSESGADCESLYEDVSLLRGQTSDNLSNRVSQAEVSRSDSWSFYDSASKERLEQVEGNLNHSDTNSILSNIYNQDPTSVTFSRPISCSSGSALDDLEALQNDIYDDIGENDSFCSSARSQSVQNELYNKCEPSGESHPLVTLRPKNEETHGPKSASRSVIVEFDPLYRQKNLSDLPSSNYDHLSLAHSSPYGKINKLVAVDELEFDESDSKSDDDVCPVIPPRRYDSITPTPEPVLNLPTTSKQTEVDVAALQSQTTEIPAKQQRRRIRLGLPSLPTRISPPKTSKLHAKPELVSNSDCDPVANLALPVPKVDASSSKTRNVTLVRWSSMKKAIKQVADGSRRSLVKVLDDVPSRSGLEQPHLPTSIVTHSGILYRASVGERVGREFCQRYCMLAEGRLTCYNDESRSDIRDVISLSSILSIQLVLDHKVSNDGKNLFCLELNVSWKGKSYIFGSTVSTERRVWMQKILESLTANFPMRISCDYNRAGWCSMKEGISGVWMSAWVLLNKRMLYYSCGAVQEIDLRKARCIELQDCGPNSHKVDESGQVILVDSPGQSLYLQMSLIRETITWRNIIKAAAVENGSNLSQQQLTKDDIPTIVDKCINFVYAHGSLSEGIYRRSGANSSVQRLLAQFRQDAWSVQLSRQEYSEFDVASVLKRFFRDLPESLLTTELHGELCEIAEGNCGADKVGWYRKALEKLPPINFLTLRKLLGHLYFIDEQREKTLMPVDNLAAIWGPTLVHIEGADSVGWSRVESSVVADLITLYPSLFDIDSAEREREKRMQEALERLHASGGNHPRPNKPSGDLQVWVHIGNRDSKNCVNVTVGPTKLAGEVCSDLSSFLGLPIHEICLEEVVFGGALIRPLHHTEQVLGTVLRWGYWDEAHRKANCLVLRKNTIIGEIAPMMKFLPTTSGELKFADQKTKSFKNYLFEFSQAKLSYYKDKSASVKLGEWRIEDIVWYIGHEPKRNPHSRWAITFIDKNNVKRCKEYPYFGCTIAGSSKADQMRWMAAMLTGEYRENFLPDPVLIQ